MEETLMLACRVGRLEDHDWSPLEQGLICFPQPTALEIKLQKHWYNGHHGGLGLSQQAAGPCMNEIS
jgi:hypothetical protein